MSQDSYYRVKIRTEQFEVEIDSKDKSFVEEKLEKYAKDFAIHSPKKSTISASELPEGKKESLNEFLSRVEPKSAMEHAVTIAYYLEKIEGLVDISVKEIRDGFKRAKFAHSNPSQALADGKARNLLMKGSSGSYYVVTSTGEKWVRDRMKGLEE